MWRREDGKNINYNGESGESRLIYRDSHDRRPVGQDNDFRGLTPEQNSRNFYDCVER